jgi:hypothetical protein
MNRFSKLTAGVGLGVLVALGSAPRMAPAQSYFFPGEPSYAAPFSGQQQEWRNELGTTDCEGECPGRQSSCCNKTLLPI